MKIHCLSGFREVGSNAVLIESDKNIMLDFGLKVETGETPLIPKVKKIDALLLSHGHLDHVGMAPYLFNRFGQITYSTAPTRDVAALVIRDSLKVAKMRGLTPKFRWSDFRDTQDKWRLTNYKKTFRIGKTKITAYDAGHMPGSCMWLIEAEGKRILYTGDFKTTDTRLIKGADLKDLKNIDLLIMETTKSSSESSDRAASEKELFKLAKGAIDNGGTAIIASFSNRAPELIMIMQHFKPKFPIYLDGMCKVSTEIAESHPEFLRDPKKLKAGVHNTHFINSDAMRKAALKRPGAIITTGGCLDGGPAVGYIKKLYTDTKSTLLLTGHQIDKTAGKYLVDTGRLVNDEFDLKLSMPWHNIDLSGHSGRTEMLRFVKKIRPKKVICMHGDHCQRFATELRGRLNIEAIAPKNGEILKV